MGDIINGYIQLIKNQGNHVSNAVVALGSYKSSKKDHTYWYLEKHFFHEIKITHCIRQRICLFLNIVIKLNLFLNWQRVCKMSALLLSAIEMMKTQLLWKSPFSICPELRFEENMQTFWLLCLIIMIRESITLSYSSSWMVITLSKILSSLSLMNNADVFSSTTRSLDVIRFHLQMVYERKIYMNDFPLGICVNLLKSFKKRTVHSIKYEVLILKYFRLFTGNIIFCTATKLL